jgi:hypothetical protein
MRWVEHVARIGEIKNIYIISDEKLERENTWEM